MAQKRKPTKKQFEKYLSDKIDEIRKISHLEDWIIHYNFVDEYNEENVQPGFQAAASCVTSTDYNESYITFYKATYDAFLNGDMWLVDHTICHEISHVRTRRLHELAVKRFTDPDSITNEMEKLTEVISRYIHRILEPARYDKDGY